MKRFAVILLLAFGASLAVAQEASQSEAQKEERVEFGDIWKWANFIILAAGLGYLMKKHLPPMFKARTGEIQKDISEAQAIKKDAEARAAAVEVRVAALGAEMDRFRAQSKVEMQQEGDRIRQETARQIARHDSQAQQEIEAAGKTARRELKEYAAKLALELAEQRIRARVDDRTESALVDAFVADLGREESKN